MFTLEQLKEKVVELANQNPDFVYKSPYDSSRCYYLVGANCSGCIFGQAFLALDPNMKDYLNEADKYKRSISWILDDLFLYIVTPTLRQWCTRVQNKQDAGLSWKTAVEKANAAVEMTVGTAKHFGRCVRGLYIGKNTELKGKTALLMRVPNKPNKLAAQFDDIQTGLGCGWWELNREDFQLDSDF